VLNATETIRQAGLEDFGVVMAKPETLTLRLQFNGKSKDLLMANTNLSKRWLSRPKNILGFLWRK